MIGSLMPHDISTNAAAKHAGADAEAVRAYKTESDAHTESAAESDFVSDAQPDESGEDLMQTLSCQDGDCQA